MTELDSVQAHNFHLFVENGHREAWHRLQEANRRRQEAEYKFQAKRHTDYATKVVTKLDKLRAGIQQQFHLDIDQHIPPRSCTIRGQPSTQA